MLGVQASIKKNWQYTFYCEYKKSIIRFSEKILHQEFRYLIFEIENIIISSFFFVLINKYIISHRNVIDWN
jgi:hypothetical protein